ncbi:hypothetical protein D9M73_291870 [compost metagenome]
MCQAESGLPAHARRYAEYLIPSGIYHAQVDAVTRSQCCCGLSGADASGQSADGMGRFLYTISQRPLADGRAPG